MVKLNADDRTKVLRVLIEVPILRTERGREAVIESANLQAIRPNLDLSGEPAVAVPLIVATLAAYGRLTYEHEALGRFLSTMRDYVGIEQAKFLSEIINTYNMMTPTNNLVMTDDNLVPINPADIFEKIIGENTLRPIAFLQQGLLASRSVGYVGVTTPKEKWSGTGFLISTGLFITNHHVLPDRSLLPESVFRFNYQLDVRGNPEAFDEYVATVQGTFHTNKELDYSIVELDGNPGSKWNYLELLPYVPELDSRVNIVQHPNGLPKHISFQNNFVKYAKSNKIQYVTSTLPGSSGSPVFDNNWKVIGLHHAGGMLPAEKETQLYFRNQAISIKAIIEDLPDEITRQVVTITNN